MKRMLLCFWMVLVLPALSAIKTEEIPDLKPPHGMLEAEEPASQVLRWIFMAVCLVAAVALLWPRRVQRKSAEPPHARAMRELRQMRSPDPVILGEVVRRYVIETLPAPGPGMTFEELAALLAAEPRWSPALQRRLRLLIDPLEIARFAPGASGADLERLREEAISLIGDIEALRRPPVALPA